MVQVFRQYVSPRKVIFVVGEGILIFGSVLVASSLFLDKDIEIINMLEVTWPKIILISVMTQITLYFHGLYEFKTTDTTLDLASRLVQSIGIVSIALAIIYFLLPEMIIGRWIFFVSLVFLLLFLVAWRLLYAFIIGKKFFAERAIMVGTGELAKDILGEMNGRKDVSYNIAALIAHHNNPVDKDLFRGISISHGFNSICDIAEAENARSIIVALDEKRGIFPYKQLLNCKVRGMSIIDGESFYERITGKLLVERINPTWLILSQGFVKSKTARATKRLIGFIMSALMLILFVPLMLLVAIAIKLDSPGPIFFCQRRVGENGKLFVLYKFRSMKYNAEEGTGPVWTKKDDPRITRVGKIIRRIRIDEFPQLWNVLRGDMSFVGPRPERPFFVDKLKETIPYYNERFSVKPGVTGWAQVKYSYGSSEHDALEKLKYDLYYIKNMSVLLDLVVIFHTVKTVLTREGSR
jgi:sugar transferase (PEP-CTERM system associated)